MVEAVPDGTQMLCYAHFTLLINSGKYWNHTLMMMETAAAPITTRICYIGLEVSLSETEDLWLEAKKFQLSVENLSRKIFSRISNDRKRKSTAFERKKSCL